MFFYFAILAWKRLFTPPKLRFLRILPPKWGAVYQRNPKGTSLRESASFEPICAKIHRRVWPVGEFPEKGINKNNLGIFHPFAQKPPRADVHQIWHSCRGRRHNHLRQILWRSVKGCRFCRGSKITICHWLSQSLLTLGWRYHAARDNDRAACDNSTCKHTHTHTLHFDVSFRWTWISK